LLALSSLLTACVWAGALLWVCREAMRLADKHLRAQREAGSYEMAEVRRQERLLTKWAMKAKAKAAATTPLAHKLPLPADLEGIAMQESEPWAREQLMDSMRDDFAAQDNDWEKVRHSYMGR